MSDHNLTRQRVLSLIGTLWVLGIVGSLIGLDPVADAAGAHR